MPAPATYTEESLAVFMRDGVLQATAQILGMTATADYTEAVNETLLAYGVGDIARATDVVKLRALARREVWRAVVERTAGEYSFRTSPGAYERQQIHANARAALELASRAAQTYVTSTAATVPISGVAPTKATY